MLCFLIKYKETPPVAMQLAIEARALARNLKRNNNFGMARMFAGIIEYKQVCGFVINAV